MTKCHWKLSIVQFVHLGVGCKRHVFQKWVQATIIGHGPDSSRIENSKRHVELLQATLFLVSVLSTLQFVTYRCVIENLANGDTAIGCEKDRLWP